jgi:hypothetical protein
MNDFGIFRGFKFKGSVIVECIECGTEGELWLLKYVDILAISNQADDLLDDEYVFTDKGVYCKSCYEEVLNRFENQPMYCPKILKRGVKQTGWDGIVKIEDERGFYR